ncbi:hypothetical protein [Candidatus Nanosynbacter sp. TM7-057]|uniref:hypothetical protein n=1 Tax=Candidatus Nanosynbacter sp. TM7-057 TaxID=2902630 RepID=UPI001FB7B748|nr:hypothetical protein [Candidatus Nanosynbacter sp. TM7-057]MCJ1965209.1 hypothetical protein [Candidatus Nanosynbacter sp. TM7-057]DAX34244.1 MAG TPA: holin [Caudoviricetes sp.]
MKLKALKNIDYKDVAIRAGWTFLQTFIATFLLAGVNLVNLLFAASWHELYALIMATALSAIAAGLSAAKTIILDLVRQMKEAVE